MGARDDTGFSCPTSVISGSADSMSHTWMRPSLLPVAKPPFSLCELVQAKRTHTPPAAEAAAHQPPSQTKPQRGQDDREGRLQQRPTCPVGEPRLPTRSAGGQRARGAKSTPYLPSATRAQYGRERQWRTLARAPHTQLAPRATYEASERAKSRERIAHIRFMALKFCRQFVVWDSGKMLHRASRKGAATKVGLGCNFLFFNKKCQAAIPFRTYLCDFLFFELFSRNEFTSAWPVPPPPILSLSLSLFSTAWPVPPPPSLSLSLLVES